MVSHRDCVHLSRVLGLMYTAHERFISAELRLRDWVAPVQFDAAMNEVIAELDNGASRAHDLVETRLHLSIGSASDRRFDVASLDGWTPHGYAGAIEIILLPMRCISDLDITEVGETMIAGRQAIEIEAVVRRQSMDLSGSPFGYRLDKHRFALDSERGVLLSLTSFSRGRPVSGDEVHWVRFDSPVPRPVDARFEEISEVVRLLYCARRSFVTVRLSSRRWDRSDIDQETDLWVENPTKFREETRDPNGRQVHVVNENVWWRLRTANDIITNASPDDIRGFESVSIHDYPTAPMYEDSEYAIVSQLHLDPSWLISRMWLTPIERATWLGREAIKVRGEPVRRDRKDSVVRVYPRACGGTGGG